MSAVHIPADAAAADAAIASTEKPLVLNFCATWAEPCALCNTAFAELL